MDLKPYDRTIKQIFNNIEYDIDFYQREYKWSDRLDYKPITSILNDIYHPFEKEYKPNLDTTQENIQKFEWYYLNSFMSNLDGRKFIVDGQQRLTTLTLISLALYHLASENKLEHNIVDTLKNSVFGSNEYGTTFWVGFRDRKEALNDILNNNLEYQRVGENISETNIYENYGIIYSFLEKKLTTVHKMKTFILYFRERVILIEIEVDKTNDVAMVFEVINDRGVPLKAYEILKGKLLSSINKSDNEKYIDIWEKKIAQIESFGEKWIDNFFFHFFRGRYSDNSEQYRSIDKEKYHKTIFLDDFNAKIKLKSDEQRAKDFIEKELIYYVDIYCDIIKNYNDYNKDYEHIYFNGINDIDGQFVLILSAIELNDKYRNEKIQLVSKLFDRHFVILQLTSPSYRSNDFNNSVIALNTLIRNKDLSAIRSNFENKLIEDVAKANARDTLDTSFKYELFKNKNYSQYGAGFLRYFYARVDHYVAHLTNLPAYGNYYQLALQSKGDMVFHIDHIITNNEKNKNLFDDEEDFNIQRNRLGALVLLKGKDNQSSNDELYKDKLQTYSVKGARWAQTLTKGFYKSNPDFKKSIKRNSLDFKPYSNFAKNEIEERHELLFNIVKLIWEL